MNNQTSIPITRGEWEELTDEEIKSGQVVSVSEDGTRGAVCVKKGLVVSFIGCFLNEDGTIKGVIPRPVNKYTKVAPIKVECLKPDQVERLREWDKEDKIIKEE